MSGRERDLSSRYVGLACYTSCSLTICYWALLLLLATYGTILSHTVFIRFVFTPSVFVRREKTRRRVLLAGLASHTDYILVSTYIAGLRLLARNEFSLGHVICSLEFSLGAPLLLSTAQRSAQQWDSLDREPSATKESIAPSPRIQYELERFFASRGVIFIC